MVTSTSSPAKNAEPTSTGLSKKAKADDLRKRHGELWLQCSKVGLVKSKDAVQAWSITPATAEAEIAKKIAGMEAALKSAERPRA